MVQEFHVLKCFSCQSFQVQQVKKSSRWSCKMCGEKQSVVKEFGRGSGADCRRHVQKLNARRGAMLEEQDQLAWSLWEEAEGCEDGPEEHDGKKVEEPQMSRWTKYLAQPHEEEEEPEENVLMDRNHGNRIAGKRKRRGGGRGREGGRSFPRGEEEDVWTPGQPNSSSPVWNRATLTSTPSTLNTASITQTGAPTGHLTGPPAGYLTGPHTGAPTGHLTGPPTGHLTGPHTGHPTSHLTGRLTGPHTGPPPGRLTGPHTGPPPGRLTGPHTGPLTGPHTGPSTGSRWSKFLSAACQDEEDEEEEEEELSGRKRGCGSRSQNEADGLIFNRLKSAVSPTHKLPGPKCHVPISNQAPPTEQQRPAPLPAGSLFDTGEDFDDMF